MTGDPADPRWFLPQKLTYAQQSGTFPWWILVRSRKNLREGKPCRDEGGMHRQCNGTGVVVTTFGIALGGQDDDPEPKVRMRSRVRLCGGHRRVHYARPQFIVACVIDTPLNGRARRHPSLNKYIDSSEGARMPPAQDEAATATAFSMG